MKILTKTATAISKALGLGAGAEAEIEKRNGLYVSRPVLNSGQWDAWAERHKIPGYQKGELHVTVVHSRTDVKIKPDNDPLMINTKHGSFCLFGPKSDYLVFAFCHWKLWDRNWDYISAGCTTDWPTYRPHMTIAADAADYEISDEALADAPDWIVLGAEVMDEPRFKDADSDPEGVDVEMAVANVVISDEVAKDAAALLESGAAGDVVDTAALMDISRSKPITPGVANRLKDAPWATDLIKSLAPTAPAPKETPPSEAPAAKGRVEKEVTITVKALPKELEKAVDVSKVAAADAERMVVGIASVSTIGGEAVVDLHGDTITTQALVEFSRDIIRGSRAGKFDHVGDNCNEIVQSFVLSEEIQKALGFDLGFECLLIEMHVPNDDDWGEVQKGNWAFSIAGTMFIDPESE